LGEVVGAIAHNFQVANQNIRTGLKGVPTGKENTWFSGLAVGRSTRTPDLSCFSVPLIQVIDQIDFGLWVFGVDEFFQGFV
jgi:hypothetical protein